jgi:hypothetical protein
MRIKLNKYVCYFKPNITFFYFLNFRIFPGQTKNGHGFLDFPGELLKLDFCEKKLKK